MPLTPLHHPVLGDHIIPLLSTTFTQLFKVKCQILTDYGAWKDQKNSFLAVPMTEKSKFSPIPCFQKRLEPAKPLLCLKYSYLEIQIGFVLKHITYHLFMQNFNVVAPAVWLPHSFKWKCGEPLEKLLMKLIDRLS